MGQPIPSGPAGYQPAVRPNIKLHLVGGPDEGAQFWLPVVTALNNRDV